MKLHKYKNYEEYRKVQEAGNIQKIKCQWAQENEIKSLANYIKKQLPNAKFGICHGTRRGNEQKWFREALGIDVIGTEISKTATDFPHTIQWDFHEVKPEWVNNVDFIYSNTFDHSFDPPNCLDRWMSCIKKQDGFCIIEWTKTGHGDRWSNELDPFGASLEELEQLIKIKYAIKEKIPFIKKGEKAVHFVVEHLQKTK